MVLAIQDEPQSRLGMAIDLVIVGLVGLTGPFIVFIAPVIVARLVWHSRSRYNVMLAALAGLVAAIQISFIFSSNQAGSDNANLMETLPSIFSNFWFGLFFGFLTQAPSEIKWILITLTVAAANIFWLLSSRRTKVIAAIFSAVSIIIFTAALRKLGVASGFIHSTGAGQRYFYIPYVLITWIFILGILQTRKPANWIATALVLMIVASAARSFQAPPLPDMEWRRQVATIGAEPIQIPINPVGWFVTIHR
jgi:hypothetical protein